MDQKELHRLALAGVRLEIERLNALARSLEGQPSPAADGRRVSRKRPPMSAAARKAISLRMKARWAEKRKKKKEDK